MSGWSDIQTARYINLATYRKSGVAVETPVWGAGVGQAVYAFSEGKAGKVKRLRNNSTVRVAVCDVRGKLLGEWQDAEAVLVQDPNEVAQAEQAMRNKYGWQILLTNWMAKLTGRYRQRAYIRIVEQP